MSTAEVIPVQAQYELPSDAVPSKRVSSVLVPTSGPNCTGGGRFTINIPPTGYFDPSRSFLTFGVQVKCTNPTHPDITRAVAGTLGTTHGTGIFYDTLEASSTTASVDTASDQVDLFIEAHDQNINSRFYTLNSGSGATYPKTPKFLGTVVTNNGNATGVLQGSSVKTGILDTQQFPGTAAFSALFGAPNFAAADIAVGPPAAITNPAILAERRMGVVSPGLNTSVISPSITTQLLEPFPVKPDQFSNSIHSIFDRIVLRSQTGVVLEDITDYNLLANIQRSCFTNLDYNETVGKSECTGSDEDLANMFSRCLQDQSSDPLVGSYKSYSHNTVVPVAGVPSPGNPYTILLDHNDKHVRLNGYENPDKGVLRFNLQPMLGLLNADFYLPLLFMGGLSIEFYLAQPQISFIKGRSTGQASVTTVDNGNLMMTLTPTTRLQFNNNFPYSTTLGIIRHIVPYDDINRNFTYELTNIEYHVDMVNFTPEYDDSLAATIQAKGINIPFVSVTNHHNNVNLSSGTTITIQDRSSSIRAALAVFRRTSELYGSRGETGDILGTYRKDGIKSYQWRIGTRVIPNQPVNCDKSSNESYAQALITAGKYADTRFKFGDTAMEQLGCGLRPEHFYNECLTDYDADLWLFKNLLYYHPYAFAQNNPNPAVKDYSPLGAIFNDQIVTPAKCLSLVRKFMPSLESHARDLEHLIKSMKNFNSSIFPFDDPHLNEKFKFIIAQVFNEHKNLKSGLNTATTALPIELTVQVDTVVRQRSLARDNLEPSNETHRYDVFIIGDRTLNIQCGGVLTLMF